MCEFCKKVAIIKEIVTTYFTDEELEKMARDMNVPLSNEPEAAKAAVAMIAAVEIALDYGLSPMQIHESLTVAIQRYYMRELYNILHGGLDA